MIEKFYGGFRGIVSRHWRRVVLICIGGALITLTAMQFLYPSGNLLPFTNVDGLSLSSWNKEEAIKELDSEYRQVSIDIFFGSDSGGVYSSPNPTELGIIPSNEQRIRKMDYPWYLRLAPGSLLWGHFIIGPNNGPTYLRDSEKLSNYIKAEWGDSCSVQTKDASLAVVDGSIVMREGKEGGTCDISDVKTALESVQLSITSEVSVVVPANLIPATVSNIKAQQLADTINQSIKDGVEITVGEEKVLIPKEQIVSWIDFGNSDGKLDFSFNVDRAKSYLTEQLAEKATRPAGVTVISTYDFVEESRSLGSDGQSLDIVQTLANLKNYVSGKSNKIEVGVVTTPPTIEYERNYSQTYEGLAALMKNFAATHSGTYGIALTELSGQYRRATYNGSKSFTTASTYKLFVAYSTLKRIESGMWHWTDQIHGGRDLTKCFDDMIVVSDNECAHALLDKIGFTNITNEAHSIGCINTSFLGSDAIKSTPEDIALLLAELQTGQILTQQSSRDTLINAMKRNVYRLGIPKGATGTVADKVGFLDALLHDAAIVYSAKGPYVLVIMTEGSSWSNIAELTRQLDSLIAK